MKMRTLQKISMSVMLVVTGYCWGAPGATVATRQAPAPVKLEPPKRPQSPSKETMDKLNTPPVLNRKNTLGNTTTFQTPAPAPRKGVLNPKRKKAPLPPTSVKSQSPSNLQTPPNLQTPLSRPSMVVKAQKPSTNPARENYVAPRLEEKVNTLIKLDQDIRDAYNKAYVDTSLSAEQKQQQATLHAQFYDQYKQARKELLNFVEGPLARPTEVVKTYKNYLDGIRALEPQ